MRCGGSCSVSSSGLAVVTSSRAWQLACCDRPRVVVTGRGWLWASRVEIVTVKFGQDLRVVKLLYQEVRFPSEGRYRIFWERRSCTKKCEKTLQMVRLLQTREDPDHF